MNVFRVSLSASGCENRFLTILDSQELVRIRPLDGAMLKVRV